MDLKDIEKAEEVIRQSDPSSTKPVKDFEDTVSSRTSLPDSQKDTSSSTTIAATTTVTTVSTSLSSSSFLQSDRERERTGSNLSSRDMPKDDSSSSLRRRNWDDRVDVSYIYSSYACGIINGQFSEIVLQRMGIVLQCMGHGVCLLPFHQLQYGKVLYSLD